MFINSFEQLDQWVYEHRLKTINNNIKHTFLVNSDAGGKQEKKNNLK